MRIFLGICLLLVISTSNKAFADITTAFEYMILLNADQDKRIEGLGKNLSSLDSSVDSLQSYMYTQSSNIGAIKRQNEELLRQVNEQNSQINVMGNVIVELNKRIVALESHNKLSVKAKAYVTNKRK